MSQKNTCCDISSFASAKEQRDGRSYNRGDMYEISHTKRNRSYVNDEARQKNEELPKERQTSSDIEAFVTVFGKEHHGYVRGMGLGPTPSQINGSSCRPSGSTSSSTADAKIAKMQSEIDVLTKEVAEVNELKAKVAEFDAMKEQFALIMANMQNHGSNIGSRFEVRRSSESSHNVEGSKKISSLFDLACLKSSMKLDLWMSQKNTCCDISSFASAKAVDKPTKPAEK
ncbi:hypothetical protein P8452_51609 [Trifolium repens]|nr:hypothetical protein P8452_51609 [Trifolium repens]